MTEPVTIPVPESHYAKYHCTSATCGLFLLVHIPDAMYAELNFTDPLVGPSCSCGGDTELVPRKKETDA